MPMEGLVVKITKSLQHSLWMVAIVKMMMIYNVAGIIMQKADKTLFASI